MLKLTKVLSGKCLITEDIATNKYNFLAFLEINDQSKFQKCTILKIKSPS